MSGPVRFTAARIATIRIAIGMGRAVSSSTVLRLLVALEVARSEALAAQGRLAALERGASYQKRRRARRKAAGKCIDCSEPPRPAVAGFVRCAECLADRRVLP